MSRVEIIAEDEGFRLIGDGGGRFAVLEVRNGRVYSLHTHDRREGADDAAGMTRAVGADGWSGREEAESRYHDMVEGERRYREKML